MLLVPRVKLPAPILIRPPLPEITPERVKAVGSVTVRLPLSRIVPEYVPEATVVPRVSVPPLPEATVMLLAVVPVAVLNKDASPPPELPSVTAPLSS